MVNPLTFTAEPGLARRRVSLESLHNAIVNLTMMARPEGLSRQAPAYR